MSDAAGSHPAGSRPTGPRVYVVDRFEGEIAVLETPGGGTLDVPRRSLPFGTEAGDMLQEIPRTACGERFVLLRAATEEARREVKAEIDRLAERDPGGDVTL